MFQSITCHAFRGCLVAIAAVVAPNACFSQETPALNWFRSEVQDGSAGASYRWALDPAVAMQQLWS